MAAPGAKGSFPSSTNDATKPKNIIALSNPHTRTTGFQGTRMYMADLRGRRVAHHSCHYNAAPNLFRENLVLRDCRRDSLLETVSRYAAPWTELNSISRTCKFLHPHRTWTGGWSVLARPRAQSEIVGCVGARVVATTTFQSNVERLLLF